MDPSWCPGCDKLILPKRIVVPISPTPPPPPPPAPPAPSSPSDTEHVPPPPPTPTPVPSSPEVRKKPLHGIDPARARRAYGGGLLQGTGRLRPGGGLRPRFPPSLLPEQQQQQPKKVITPPQLAPRAVQEAQMLQGNPTATRIGTVHPPLGPPIVPVVTQAPRKTRVVISQEPTPLYCSDECRARDLKNSFIESESAGFAGASAARDRVAQFELINKTVERSMQSRRHSNSSDKSATQPSTPSDAFPSPILPLQPESEMDREPRLPPVPPNSLVDPPPPLFHTGSLSSSSASSSVSSAHLRGSTSKNSTIRASAPKSRPSLLLRASSFSTWGSPTKAALAPPARSLLTVSSSSSVGSSLSSSAGSALFDDEALAFVAAEAADGADTCGTTPSRRGSGSSTESTKKTQKRVSFAGDAKPAALAKTAAPPPEHAIVSPKEEWPLLRRRRRNPLLDANPLRDAISVSPKDRVKASSLPSYSWADNSEDTTNGNVGNTTSSRSTPILCGRVVDTPLPSRRPRYNVAMWPEDEKRTTESARVHGELLRAYAKRFGPREGRSLVWSPLWRETEAEAAAMKMSVERGAKGSASLRHERQPDSKKSYWKLFEEQEAEARARRKAEAEVKRMEEERVICELLGGAGMREEDQPQARKMKQMAYDGMPGPAELRGLTYKFDRFLYPLVPPKPKIVEKTVTKWDEGRKAWVEELMREEVFEERKKLFNFSED